MDAIGACGDLWMLMDSYWCLWRPMDLNGWLLVLMETYGGPWMPTDGYWCLWRPMDANGWLLMPVEAYGC